MSKASPITDLDGWFVGEDKTLQWVVYTDDDTTIQAVTGWTGTFKLGDSPGDVGFYSEATVVADGPGGVLQVDSAAADTSALTPGTYWYTLSRTNAGFNAVLAEGPVTLKGRVT